MFRRLKVHLNLIDCYSCFHLLFHFLGIPGTTLMLRFSKGWFTLYMHCPLSTFQIINVFWSAGKLIAFLIAIALGLIISFAKLMIAVSKYFLPDSLPSAFAGCSMNAWCSKIRYLHRCEGINFQREHGKPVLCYDCIKFKVFFITIIKFWSSYKNEQAIAVAIFFWVIGEWDNFDGGVIILQKGEVWEEWEFKDEGDKHFSHNFAWKVTCDICLMSNSRITSVTRWQRRRHIEPDKNNWTNNGCNDENIKDELASFEIKPM